MPTYDYVCDACGHTYELFQSITARPRKKCPACGKPKARRLIGTGAGIIFKGSGFYETDYRSESYKQAAKAEADAASGKKSDDKPDKKGASESKPKSGSKDKNVA
jgi:putative FmdB family regulatory protein